MTRSDKIRCKWCGRTFDNIAGLSQHLRFAKEDGTHPESATSDNSGIRVPPTPAGTVEGEDLAQRFRNRLQKLEEQGPFQHDTPENGTAEAENSVPISELEKLLDSLRMREGQAGGFYVAAQELQELIQEHRVGVTP